MNGLMIIDMQYVFANTAGHKTLRKNILAKIIEYKQQELPIILVEYRHWHGHYVSQEFTYSDLVDELAGYEHLHKCEKEDDDGGYEVKDVINKYCKDVEIWEMVGVNFQYCVGKTARSLAQIFPDLVFNVNLSCCRSPYNIQSSVRAFRRLQDETDYGNLMLIGHDGDIGSWSGDNYGECWEGEC
jgi:hypothetical protein